MDNYKKIKIFVFLSIPPILLFIFILLLLKQIVIVSDLPQYAIIFTIAFLVVFLIQLSIFKTKVLSQFTEMDKLQKAVDDQQKGARMLIRRDLELTRANEKLHALDEMKSNFISVVAHQLRTPLSGIKWTINMILSGDLGSLTTDQESFLKKSYESNERMISLVNDMLDADRIDSEKLKYQFTPIDISLLLDDVLYEMVPSINKKKLHIEFVGKNKDLPKVLADHEKMRAVLQNLIENAVKYNYNGGKIEVIFEVIPGFLEMSVKDSGIGIPQDQVKNIFNRFFRASNAIKIETDGSGLGLFITKRIVERHGGKIWFESENEKTIFHFTIPIVS